MIIYKITNKINGKSYVGQTVCSLKKRWREHISPSSKNCILIKRAIEKYGQKNFTIEEIGGANNLSELNYQEWFLIHKNNSLWPNGYNLREGGGNKRHSDLTKKKISQSQIGRSVSQATRNKISETKKAQAKNPEIRKKLSEIRKGKKAKIETIQKMKASWNPKSIEHTKRKVLDMNTGVTYSSVTETSLRLGIPRRTLCRLLNKQTTPINKYKNLNLIYVRRK